MYFLIANVSYGRMSYEFLRVENGWAGMEFTAFAAANYLNIA